MLEDNENSENNIISNNEFSEEPESQTKLDTNNGNSELSEKTELLAPSEKLSKPGQNFSHLKLLLDIKMDLIVEIGRTRMSIDQILELGLGSIVELDKVVEDKVDILVNNKLIAKGELVSIDENFGVRIIELIEIQERFKLHSF